MERFVFSFDVQYGFIFVLSNAVNSKTMNNFSCEVLQKHAHTNARVTRVTTAHGDFITPVFMPVGTRAAVNNMTPKELRAAGSQIILGGNTYHMLCAPGMEVIEQAGGMHAFMGWQGPML